MEAPADIRTGLNEQQRKAVEHSDGPLLVIAGAGTGKTRAITARICWLLANHAEISGENILGLTYTRKAAGVMHSRVKKSAGERAEGIWLGTFHSFCVEKILSVVNPDLLPIEEADHWILLRRHIGEFGLKHFSRLADPGKFLGDFREFFSRCQDELVTSEEYARFVQAARKEFDLHGREMPEDERHEAEERIEKWEEVARAYGISERLLREKQFITFGGQILQAVKHLRENPELLAGLRNQYRYILVDEFQDTNIAQLELLWLLAGDSANIFAVGDDDQAIYRFRGASFGSFTIFLERFAHHRNGGGKPASPLVSLTSNYRSSQRILRAAQQVIQFNEKSPLLPAKNLTTIHPPGEKIRIAEFTSRPAEAEWIASEIDRLRGAGGAWSDFAVLYRSHVHRNDLIRALRRREIPFTVHKLSIMSNTLIRDVLAWLRAIAHPGDDVAFSRLMALPRWGYEPADLVRLAERARGKSLVDALDADQKDLPFAGGTKRPEEFLALLQNLRKFSRKSTTRQLFDELVKSLTIATLASDADQACIEFLSQFILEWEKKSDAKGVRDFLEYFGYYQQAGGALSPEDALTSGDAVQLMTVHGAKGLEFDHVFVMQLTKGSFPPNNRTRTLEFPSQLMKEELPKTDFRIQEERRLFYVALTRARRRLTLTTVVGPKKSWSPFLDDLLRDAQLKSRDIEQLTPLVNVPADEETAAPVPADSSHPGLFTSVPADSLAYSQIALWARAYHPPLPEPLHLSASAIDSYRNCPLSYLFQNVWRIRGGPRPAMMFGSVMHTALREMASAWQRRQPLTINDVDAIYAREWRHEGYEDAYQDEEYRRAGLNQLREFYGTHSEKYKSAPPDILFLEKTFELPLEHNIVVSGRMDVVNRLPDGTVEIIDYKTGSPKEPKDARDSMQLSLYALAARDILELEPSRLVFYNLTSNNAVVSTRDEKALQRARQDVATVADSLRAGEFPAKPGFICGMCEYRLLCPEHEDLLSIRPAKIRQV